MPFLAGLRQDYTIYFPVFTNRQRTEREKKNFKKLVNWTRKLKEDSLKDVVNIWRKEKMFLK